MNEECVMLNKYGLERRKLTFPYEGLDTIDKHNVILLPPEEAFYSKLKQMGKTDENN